MERVAILEGNTWTSDPSGRNHSHLRRLSEFDCKAADPRLPGWSVFIRVAVNCAETVSEASR